MGPPGPVDEATGNHHTGLAGRPRADPLTRRQPPARGVPRTARLAAAEILNNRRQAGAVGAGRRRCPLDGTPSPHVRCTHAQAQLDRYLHLDAADRERVGGPPWCARPAGVRGAAGHGAVLGHIPGRVGRRAGTGGGLSCGASSPRRTGCPSGAPTPSACSDGFGTRCAAATSSPRPALGGPMPAPGCSPARPGRLPAARSAAALATTPPRTASWPS